MTKPIDKAASELLEVVPSIMRTIRKKWKEGPICGVTNAQFRILMFIQRHPGTSLLEVARFLGLTSPTTSITIDEMVTKNLVVREPSTHDRRKISLTLTDLGQKTLDEVFEYSRNDLASYLSGLGTKDLETVYQALKLLRPLFSTSKSDKILKRGG
jgi:DNA-binding MarR family transcriptional regulator